MGIQDWALVMGGGIGTLVAVIHGILMQKHMMPLIAGQASFPMPVRRLAPVLLHFSTFCWFFGGIGLMLATLYLDDNIKLTTAVFVGGFYVFGTFGNFWGTKARHPGWVLLGIAVASITYGVI